jgi:hypothetical protein
MTNVGVKVGEADKIKSQTTYKILNIVTYGNDSYYRMLVKNNFTDRGDIIELPVLDFHVGHPPPSGTSLHPPNKLLHHTDNINFDHDTSYEIIAEDPHPDGYYTIRETRPGQSQINHMLKSQFHAHWPHIPPMSAHMYPKEGKRPSRTRSSSGGRKASSHNGPYEDRSLTDLKNLADSRNIKWTTGMNKVDIIALLRAKR